MATFARKQNVGDFERVGCLAIGGYLLARGALSSGTAATIVGGLFIYRGLAGHCCAYEALGIDTQPATDRQEA